MWDSTTPAEYVTITELVLTFVVDFMINVMFEWNILITDTLAELPQQKKNHHANYFQLIFKC